MLAPALFAPARERVPLRLCVRACVCACVCTRTYMHTRGPRCFTRQMLITDDSDRDRDSDSCPVLFDTFADYRSKAPYESKNYRRKTRHFFFPFLRDENEGEGKKRRFFSRCLRLFHDDPSRIIRNYQPAVKISTLESPTIEM